MGGRDELAAVLAEHADSGVTMLVDERAQRSTGFRAWCYCGGYTPGEDAKWHGSFDVPSEQADRELREHVADHLGRLLDEARLEGAATVADRVDAALRLIGPDHITPLGERQIRNTLGGDQ